MKKIILAITLVVLLGACEGTVQNPPSVNVDLKQSVTNISADSTELREPGGTIYVLTKKAPFGERADNFCQVIEEVEGHKFLLVKGNGIHSAPSVTHLPSCWCFKDSVK